MDLLYNSRRTNPQQANKRISIDSSAATSCTVSLCHIESLRQIGSVLTCQDVVQLVRRLDADKFPANRSNAVWAYG